ncbi:acyl-CoA reductase [Planctobacterium marinum]|uniref:acyl-CoA reductase n=1 Tax=Planctobacterium marinum TaxID=1631968 RepID=UPI001E2C408A|nr:acyl-CoA reductase [Planctobacterium marinum]MCC2606253.1 hypothetical protein [Planctobacterium marinum]
MIHRLKHFPEITYVLQPSEQQFSGKLSPFSEEIISFVNALSQALLKGSDSANQPNLVALGYWLRKSNIESIKSEFLGNSAYIYKPVGTVFHITPANVDIQFAYSWLISLLMGNLNIIRLSQQESEERTILLNVIGSIIDSQAYPNIASNNVFITYPHNDQITKAISLESDARMIWGSDTTTRAIKAITSKVSCRDIVFSDKYSICLLDLQGVSDYHQLANGLARDIQAFSQLACSSPKVIFSVGKSNLPEDLIDKVYRHLTKENYSSARTTNHLVAQQMCAARNELLKVVRLPQLTVLQLSAFSTEVLDWHNGEGLLYWINIESIEQLTNVIDEKCQTISHFNIDQTLLIKLINELPINTVDRVVPVGQALNFSIVWDGYDLTEYLSRKVTVIPGR